MPTAFNQLLSELEQFGQDNDAAISDRPRRMLNITADTGEFLAVMLKAIKARDVLEIGTSNGYSTLWLASAAQATHGHVTTVEYAEFKYVLALDNFQRAQLTDCITAIHDDAGAVFERTADAAYDLIFLDSERSQYLDWWPHIKRVLRPGGLLVVDNALSHAAEMAEFAARVKADPAFTVCTVPVGNGELVATHLAWFFNSSVRAPSSPSAVAMRATSAQKYAPAHAHRPAQCVCVAGSLAATRRAISA